MTSSRHPLSQQGPLHWLGLALAVLVMLYLAFVVATLFVRGLFDSLGGDYRSFYTSAQIAWSHGFGQVYNLETQQQYQWPLYETYATGPWRANYATVPTPFLPAFILPFLALLLLPPVPGFVALTIVSVTVAALYLRRFLREIGAGDKQLVLAILISFAFFANLTVGQVSIWMIIFMGEFFLAMRRGQELQAGLWLGGMLLKPQSLIFLLPGLLITRRFKALAGFSLTAAVLLAISLLLSGPQGLYSLATLLLGYAGGLTSNSPEAMMNWRGLATNLASFLPSSLAWGVAIVGMVATTVVGLSFWFRRADPASPQFAIALLGSYAATCAVTWHSHAHMGLALVPLFLFLVVQGLLARPVLAAWSVFPGLVFFVTLLAAPGTESAMVGVSFFLLNLYLVVWSARTFWRTRPGDEISSIAPLGARSSPGR